MKSLIIFAILCLFLFACRQDPQQQEATPPLLKEIETPVKVGGEPNLFVSENGQVYLSWVEYLNDTTDALMFSVLAGDRWSEPRTIAGGSDWFVNWADFPSLVAYKGDDKTLAAHWLAMSAPGTYDYDVHIAQSLDGGQSWSGSFIPHTDGVAAEHGFVSMLPLSEDRMFAAWLDGRYTKTGKKESGNDGHGHGGGAMTIRTATFDRDGNLYDEAELDHRVCDCCQTDAAVTSNGPVVVYRDRSDEEIRDIAIVRKMGGQWTEPEHIFEDNWKIAGCPVNGPRIAASGDNVAVAWFSAAQGESQVKVVFSKDAGASFGKPVRLDEGKPLGRVDIILLEPQTALVCWMETFEDNTEIRAIKVGPEGKKGETMTITNSSSSRKSGFPVMAKTGDGVLFAWTQADSISRVRTGLILDGGR